MMYYRRNWRESRGDAFDHWGSAVYYFETAEDGSVRRQVEVYANGNVLRYEDGHSADEYGALADQPLALAEYEPFRVPQAMFTAVWPEGEPPGLQPSGPNVAGD